MFWRSQVLLAIDIGNTSTVFGLFSGDQLLSEFRVDSQSPEFVERSRITIVERAELSAIERVVVASVVPRLNLPLREMLSKLIGVTPQFIGSDIPYPMKLNLLHPEQVGADRVVNAVAARELYHQPAIVVDFGTATTFDIVADGEYQGGIIAPGVQLAMEALAKQAAQLSKIDLVWPDQLIGKTTVAAMQSGSIRGYLALVDGLIAQLREELGGTPAVIATGGLGALFANHSKWIEKYEATLTLQGIRIIADHSR